MMDEGWPAPGMGLVATTESEMTCLLFPTIFLLRRFFSCFFSFATGLSWAAFAAFLLPLDLTGAS